MTKRTLPPQSYLIQCFEYDPLTGVLRWRARPQDHFKSDRIAARWNAEFAGKPAGFICATHGYAMCAVMHTRYRVHRIVWKMMTGDEPDSIDHINGRQTDNRWANLRSCTHGQNMQNCTHQRSNNTSGAKGVHPCKGRWRAMIRIEGKSTHIGIFDTVEEASRAYRAAAERTFGEFARQP